jgi:hypothetical protein
MLNVPAGFVRILQQNIRNNRKRKRYVPERKEPGSTTQPTAEKTGRAVCTRKVERLQKRERAAENIAACEKQKSAVGLDRILRKQKNLP